MMGYCNGSLSVSGIICSVNAGSWLLIILLILLPFYYLALMMIEGFKQHRSSKPKNVKHKNDKELRSIDEVSKYFDIDITETDTDFLVGVKRRSDGEDMRDTLVRVCDFPRYMKKNYGFETVFEDRYGFEVVFEDDKYILKKDTYKKASPDEKDPDTNDVRSWVEMFILENRHSFKYSDWKKTERNT